MQISGAPSDLVSAVLAGGRSARMGTNKALLRAHPTGLTLVEMVVERLTDAHLPPAMLVTNSPSDFSFLGIPMLPDDIPGGGSLGGILTALNHAPTERVFVAACDMPSLNPALIRYMAALPAEHDALIPRWTDAQGGRHLETLHAIYSRRCIAPIAQRVRAGKLKVADLAADISVRFIEGEELRRYDPDLSAFRNVNTPEEWAALGQGREPETT
jgi:molybdopterin-guanine dinucleotide biosynthesis protein A